MRHRKRQDLTSDSTEGPVQARFAVPVLRARSGRVWQSVDVGAGEEEDEEEW